MRGRPQMTITRMRVSRSIPKATNTQSQYVILLVFPLQQLFHECALMLRCTSTAGRDFLAPPPTPSLRQSACLQMLSASTQTHASAKANQ
jgi:hypothetical protein